MRMPSRTPCAEGDGWRLCRACLAWGHSRSRQPQRGQRSSACFREEWNAERAWWHSAGSPENRHAGAHQAMEGGLGTGLRGDPCSGQTGRHALSLLLALEHPGCSAWLTSAGTLPAAPTPGWNNQKCLQRQTTPDENHHPDTFPEDLQEDRGKQPIQEAQLLRPRDGAQARLAGGLDRGNMNSLTTWEVQ